jgi:hypothetical protein
LLEVQDVVETLRDAGPVAWLVGMGHGATYAPRESDPEENTTPEGVVHHIHIGPPQVLFRYGVAGFLMMSACGVLGIFRWSQAIGEGGNLTAAQRVWLLALTGTIVTFIVFGALHDPLFSASLAALLVAPYKPAQISRGHSSAYTHDGVV